MAVVVGVERKPCIEFGRVHGPGMSLHLRLRWPEGAWRAVRPSPPAGNPEQAEAQHQAPEVWRNFLVAGAEVGKAGSGGCGFGGAVMMPASSASPRVRRRGRCACACRSDRSLLRLLVFVRLGFGCLSKSACAVMIMPLMQ